MRFFRFMNTTISNIYPEILPGILLPTTILGMITGLTAISDNTSNIDSFITTIGFTSIGVITGLAFPISFPLLEGYMLYNALNKKQ